MIVYLLCTAFVTWCCLGPMVVVKTWKWLERRPGYEDRVAYGVAAFILSGPILWVAGARRYLANRLRNRRILRAARKGAKAACAQSLGKFTYVDGELVKKELNKIESEECKPPSHPRSGLIS